MRPDYERRQYLYARYNRWSEWPLLALALVMVGNLFLPDMLGVSDQEGTVFDTIDWVIYFAFVIDFIIKIYLAPSVREHLRRNWIDLIILALPLLRPLRILRSARLLRLARLARVFALGVFALRRFMAIFRRRHFHIIVFVVFLCIMGAAGLVFYFEREGGGNIHSYLDALWWAVATVTTVGYGDATPVTAEGRVVAICLMLVGIAFYGLLTANIAAFFVEAGEEKKDAELAGKIEILISEIAELKGSVAALSQAVPQSAPSTPPEERAGEPEQAPEPALSRH
jgi:voltage-gated potassium channel